MNEYPDSSHDSGEIDLTPDDDLQLTINGYRLIREINQGGQAIIFLAVQESTGRKVALKLVPGGPLAASRERRLMEKEVRILAALDHPNIVSVIDKGTTADGSSYFVLEYVHGQTLSEYVDSYFKRFKPHALTGDRSELIRLFARICDAVNAAHLRGIVHRDLKPANIIIDSHGEPHILDFGLARSPVHMREGLDDPNQSDSGQFIGSLQWASPEQAEGVISKVDIRSDVYSLGVILFEMLTGEFPYDVFGTLNEVLDNIINTPPNLPSKVVRDQWNELSAEDKKTYGKFVNPVSPRLDQVLVKALAKSREDRYQSAGELGKALVQALAADSMGTPPGKRLVQVGVAAGLAALALGVALTSWVSTSSSSDEAQIPVSLALPYGTFGYRIEGDEVVFTFDPREYHVVRMHDGSLGTMDDAGEITEVNMAGPFNQWTTHMPEWSFTRVSPLRFELRKPLEVFEDRSRWPFKFVVNGGVWVGAPRNAVNKEVVVEDPATYNLLFVNPEAPPGAFAEEIRKYQNQIEQSWPGQGGNLAVDEAGRFHFTYVQIPTQRPHHNLDPLRGIPLSSLDLSQSRTADFSALRYMNTLEKIILPDATYQYLFNDFQRALDREDYAAARQELNTFLEGLENVPAFRKLHRLLMDGVGFVASMMEDPEEVPAGAKFYGGRYYGFLPVLRTWDEARGFAEQHGAVLTTVRGPDHQEWLVGEFGVPSAGRTVWIGGTDEQVEGSWGWLSGEPWYFENWTGQEPNNGDGNENAAAMAWNGWWFDYRQDGIQLPMIVEWIGLPVAGADAASAAE